MRIFSLFFSYVFIYICAESKKKIEKKEVYIDIEFDTYLQI